MSQRKTRASSPAPAEVAKDEQSEDRAKDAPKMSSGGFAVQARHVQLYLLFGSRMMQTVIRMAMGPLVVYMCEDFVCDENSKPNLLAAFSLGYLLTQVGGGLLADVIGAKTVITFATLGGGICTIGTAYSGSVYMAWVTQVMMGLSQGPLFPTSMAFLAKWLPPDERAFAATLLDSGITAGSLVALPFSGSLAAAFGWRATFAMYGAASIVFTFVWHWIAVAEPGKCTYITKEELQHLEKTVKPKPKQNNDKNDSTWKLLTHPAVWSIYISHMAFNFGVYFLNSWPPTYYKDELNTRPEDATVAFMLPATVNLLVKVILCTPFENWMRNKCHFGTLQCRRAFCMLGFAGSAACVLLIQPAKPFGIWASTACFTVALFFVAFHPGGFKANYLDVTRASSGLVSGIGNTLASVASYVGPLVVGRILNDFHSWDLVFLSVAAANGVAAIGFQTFSTATPID